ncbi:MAG TPA: glycosyltransferase [Vicinamibacterales bacterium]|nr:glycosyltransferase [Vicinamibacterales bacterium]
MSDQPVPIVYLVDSYTGPRAGTEVQLLELLRGLDRRRFEPSLAVLRPTPFIAEPGRLPCASVQVLRIHRLLSPRSWFRMAAFAATLRRRGVRLAHIFFNDASVIGPPFLRLAGIRIVVARRDMGFWYTPAMLRCLRVSGRFVDAVVANCEAVRLNVHRLERYPLARARVIPNGQRLERFLAPADPTLRSRLGIPPEAPIVGMVANLKPIKRHEDLLRAFSIVRLQHPTAHLLLAGSGELEADLRTLAHHLDLAGCVHFAGPVDDAVPVVRHCAVCVLSSESEGLSNALIEYLGCAKPVVCTNTGGNAEVVREGENGFLVEVGDVAALADRIGRLLADPALARTMGRRARRRFVDRYTVDRMLAEHMRLYDELLETRHAA